jgi:hypothetical protein
MIRFLTATAFAAGLTASPAAANITLLDFTSSAIGTGTTSGSAAGATWSISSSPGALTDADHDNAIGCSAPGWAFACDAIGGGRFDVGFGVNQANSNEVDLNVGEYVSVTFSGRDVFLNGFAGMLTYFDGNGADGSGFEDVVLEAYLDGSLLTTFSATALDDDTGNTFPTVGLAFLDVAKLRVDEVRFLAGGTPNFDDGNANITAAGLKISPVPLPAGVLLLGLGLAGLGGVRRMQARRKNV